MEATKTSKISERKAALRETSNTVKELMDAGKIKASNLNDGLLAFYNGKKKSQVWLTLEQWQTAGYSVRKGETAQMIWGMKVTKTSESNEEYSYFPVAYVFSYTQVERSVRNFKEPPTDKSKTDHALVTEIVCEDLPL